MRDPGQCCRSEGRMPPLLRCRAEKFEVEAWASDSGEVNSCWILLAISQARKDMCVRMCAKSCIIDIRQGAFLDHPLANANVIRNGS